MADTTPLIVVNLGSHGPAAPAATRLIRRILGAKAVRHVEPLFPDDPDPALAGLYTVALDPAVSAAEAIAALQKDGHVEYAHTPQPRQPS
jgi:hypothetical protein